MSATSYTAFFGDAERTFDFDTMLIVELETLTSAGTGGLFNRLVKREFRYSDLLTVIRLGLIGGGTKPEEAARLTKVYAEGRPIEETYPLALSILSALWFGNGPAEPLVEALVPTTADVSPSSTAEGQIPQPFADGIGSEL